MKHITVSGDTVKIEETNFLSWAGGSVIKPVMGDPISGSQARFFGLGTFAIGALVGGTVGYKYVQKTRNAFNSFTSKDQVASSDLASSQTSL